MEMLRKIGCTVKLAAAVTAGLKEGETVLSPGMKYKHYAPKAPLTLLDGDTAQRKAFLQKKTEVLVKQGKNCAILAYREETQDFLEAFPHHTVLDLGSKTDENEQAHLLFTRLRDTDTLQIDEIYAPLPGMTGMGLALYNRMIRAAAHKIITLSNKE